MKPLKLTKSVRTSSQNSVDRSNGFNLLNFGTDRDTKIKVKKSRNKIARFSKDLSI